MSERDQLMTTAELAATLDQPSLRLFDCTTYLDYQPAGGDIPISPYPGGTPSKLGIFRERIFWICKANSPTRIRRFTS